MFKDHYFFSSQSQHLPQFQPLDNVLCQVFIYLTIWLSPSSGLGVALTETYPNVKYDAPEEVGGERKCFESPIRK